MPLITKNNQIKNNKYHKRNNQTDKQRVIDLVNHLIDKQFIVKIDKTKNKIYSRHRLKVLIKQLKKTKLLAKIKHKKIYNKSKILQVEKPYKVT